MNPSTISERLARIESAIRWMAIETDTEYVGRSVQDSVEEILNPKKKPPESDYDGSLPENCNDWGDKSPCCNAQWFVSKSTLKGTRVLCNNCGKVRNEPKKKLTLAQKFEEYRQKMGSGKGDRYWCGLARIAESHFAEVFTD